MKKITIFCLLVSIFLSVSFSFHCQAMQDQGEFVFSSKKISDDEAASCSDYNSEEEIADESDDESTVEDYQWIKEQSGKFQTVLELNSKINLTTDDFQKLAKNCPNVQVVFFHQNSDVADEVLYTLAKFFPNIKELVLNGCTITNSSGEIKGYTTLEIIGTSFPRLEDIGLEWTDIVDDDFVALTSKCTKLKRIDLNYTDVSFSALQNLAKQFTSMKAIGFVKGDSDLQLTDEQTEELMLLWPGCNIER